MDDQSAESPRRITLGAVVDVADRTDLLETVSNDAVAQLSRSGGGSGYRDADNVLRSTGIETRYKLRAGRTVLSLATAALGRLQQVAGPKCLDQAVVLICHSHVSEDPAARIASGVSRWLLRRCRQMQGRVPAVSAANWGCSGFLRLLQEAVVLLETDSTLRRVVLLNVEAPELWHDASDRLFCGLISTAATATLVHRGAGIDVTRVQADDFPVPIHLRINPRPLFSIQRAGVRTFDGRQVTRTVMRMNPEPVFLAGIELMLDVLRAAQVNPASNPDGRTIVVPHQPSGKLLKALIDAARPEFPGVEFLTNLRNHGNCISATIPTMLARLPEVLALNGRASLRSGDRLVLLAAGICMDRMEDHLSAGFADLVWGNDLPTPSAATVRREPHVV
jgi:3-oxoacyl-[acyl-carrier-protein] synthase III